MICDHIQNISMSYEFITPGTSGFLSDTTLEVATPVLISYILPHEGDEDGEIHCCSTSNIPENDYLGIEVGKKEGVMNLASQSCLSMAT